MTDKITSVAGLRKEFKEWQKRLKMFNTYREGKYSMFTTRTVNFDKYCQEFLEKINELEASVRERIKELDKITYKDKYTLYQRATAGKDELRRVIFGEAPFKGGSLEGKK